MPGRRCRVTGGNVACFRSRLTPRRARPATTAEVDSALRHSGSCPGGGGTTGAACRPGQWRGRWSRGLTVPASGRVGGQALRGQVAGAAPVAAAGLVDVRVTRTRGSCRARVCVCRPERAMACLLDAAGRCRRWRGHGGLGGCMLAAGIERNPRSGSCDSTSSTGHRARAAAVENC